jgi:hypothetical protein
VVLLPQPETCGLWSKFQANRLTSFENSPKPGSQVSLLQCCAWFTRRFAIERCEASDDLVGNCQLLFLPPAPTALLGRILVTLEQPGKKARPTHCMWSTRKLVNP